MQKTPKIEDLAKKIDFLLCRHQDILRAHFSLEQEVSTLRHERDQLRERLQSARLRVEVLMAELPPKPQDHHETN